MSEKKHENRLIFEKSPYLLQHSRNPVDWYPWGSEAFGKAKQENKMIFLSIGYSTCHWCHVMEKESFENEDVAALMNRDFISIKVDREERPDIDHIYMTAVQAMTGTGGWPLSVFLTPEGKPVTGGTYFPPEDKWGRPGMKTILPRLAEAWKTDSKDMNAAGEQLAKLLEAAKSAQGPDPDWKAVLKKLYTHFENSFDENNGGFGSAPKFPRSHELSLLLRIWKKSSEAHALEMVRKTLDSMALGGIRDHLGGGFHRYSVDDKWLISHFEKMLYDQAILARTYLETYQATGEKFYADTAREIFEYVLRDMKSPDGGFYSAEDADSEGEEGKFYVWRPEEIDSVLGVLAGKLFRDFYGVTEGGNFEHATSVLHIQETVEAFAAGHQLDPEKLAKQLKHSREKLFEHRKKRIHPYKDDKILSAWNGLMISALAYGARVLNEPAYLEAASAAADFILGKMTKNGRLLRRYREGEASIPAFQDDYACMAMGLLDLYEAGFEAKRLEQARTLLQDMIHLFEDPENGGFFYTAADAETLIVRTKEYYDGATPSGNSVAAFALLKYSRMTGAPEFEEKARQAIASNAHGAEEHPAAFPFYLTAVDYAMTPSREVVIAGKPEGEEEREIFQILNASFEPYQSVLLAAHAPFAEAKAAGGTAVYVCENYTCRKPVSSAAELRKLLYGNE